MPDPTPQQRAAVDARGTSVVLSSGAGCGKTTVLTERYVSHLKIDGVSVGQIVAITFTDRAARQMRLRIRNAIVQQIALNPENPDWPRHLRDLESASIQTIHSFCGDLLRQFAVEASLDPAFEVLEEILADNLRADALRETLLTADRPEARDLEELVILYGWTETVKSVRALLRSGDSAAWADWCKRDPNEIAADWFERRTSHLPQWIEYLRAASPKIAHLVKLLETFKCTGPKMLQRVQIVKSGLASLASAADLNAAVEELCEAAKVVGTEGAKAWPDAETYTVIKDAMTDFRGDLARKMELFLMEPEGVEAAVIVGQQFLRVALAVVADYQARKKRVGAVDFDDLLVLARDLLRDRPEVRESLQRRYRYLLLDEMQDTDPVQMELVDWLCGIAKDHNKLFAVGDAKQSIYRFRGAEVALFDRLRDSVPVAGRLQLTVNFRSLPGVLRFVNALCSKRFHGYEPLEPSRKAKETDACVEFLWSMPTDGANKDDVTATRTREADAIARRIRELIDTNERKAGDIVLLFRSMSNVAIYEAALRQYKLDYYLVGGRAFFAQQEIHDLHNLLRALENPDDGIALAGTLRSPFACLSDDALVLLSVNNDGLWAGLHDSTCRAQLDANDRSAAERICDLMDQWRAIKDRLPIARLINKLVADTGYDAALQFESLGDRKLANLWKLIDIARTFDRSGLFGLPDFIARLSELVSDPPREEQAATQPENADVIKIMSIHQSKGLEFPVVFVPDLAAKSHGGVSAGAGWDRQLGCIARPPDEDPPLFTDFGHRLTSSIEEVADWREDLRILYVAATRAEDLLVLSAGFPEPDPLGTAPLKATNTWMLALAERFNLTTGECLDQSIVVSQRPKVVVRKETGTTTQPGTQN